jgi:hypothetical protein
MPVNAILDTLPGTGHGGTPRAGQPPSTARKAVEYHRLHDPIAPEGSMKNTPWILVAGALCLTAASLPAAAEDACLADAKRLCPDVPPGSGRVYFCVKSNWNNLSEGCQALLDWSRQRANEVALDCQGDAFSYCGGVPAGRGRLFSCLAGHRDQISSQCKKALAAVEWFSSACGADRDRLCSGIPPGDGGVIACLVTAREKLSPSCQAVFWP